MKQSRRKLLDLQCKNPSLLEEAVSFEVAALYVRRLRGQLAPNVFHKVGMMMQQAFFSGLAFGRKKLTASETKALEEHYHEFFEHMRKARKMRDSIHTTDGEA